MTEEEEKAQFDAERKAAQIADFGIDEDHPLWPRLPTGKPIGRAMLKAQARSDPSWVNLVKQHLAQTEEGKKMTHKCASGTGHVAPIEDFFRNGRDASEGFFKVCAKCRKRIRENNRRIYAERKGRLDQTIITMSRGIQPAEGYVKITMVLNVKRVPELKEVAQMWAEEDDKDPASVERLPNEEA